MEAELERLRKKLAAQAKTIATLMARVEGRASSAGSAFAVLEQNIALEHLVGRRTAELQESNRRLSAAMADLKRSQAEAAAAQRWAAVGTLAAGVAHEINTPLQFVGDSVHFMKDACADLLAVVAHAVGIAQSLEAAGVDPQQVARLRATLDAADLEYLAEALPRSIERSLQGTERVGTIVRSLKEFAHPGSVDMAPADLNQAIRNTAVIASNEYKYVADLQLDLAELPPVVCHVNDVNQVVLNLLVNAAHAVGDVARANGSKGTIRIETRRLSVDEVQITVRDTGTGIREEIRTRIFEPFFTTKEVGKGTGQGLSLAWAMVVDKHGGTIRVESELGVGTSFHVRLPVAGRTPVNAERQAEESAA